MQIPLVFADPPEPPRRIDLPGAEACLHAAAFTTAQADQLLIALRDIIAWRQDTLRFAGREVPVPRLQAWYGDPGTGYRYSGLRLEPLPWTPLLSAVRRRVETLAGASFNAVLLNYYRHGNDSVSWHSDDEKELGPDPLIASVSLGATRRFEFRRKSDGLRRRLDLDHGSLLVMGRGVQTTWQHRIPKQPAINDPRINLTFRRILGDSSARD